MCLPIKDILPCKLEHIMQILKGTGIVWHERRWICKFYVDQSVKIQLEHREISVKIGKEVRQGCSLSPILFDL